MNSLHNIIMFIFEYNNIMYGCRLIYILHLVIHVLYYVNITILKQNALLKLFLPQKVK